MNLAFPAQNWCSCCTEYCMGDCQWTWTGKWIGTGTRKGTRTETWTWTGTRTEDTEYEHVDRVQTGTRPGTRTGHGHGQGRRRATDRDRGGSEDHFDGIWSNTTYMIVYYEVLYISPLTTYWWFFPNQVWKFAESLDILWSASNFRRTFHCASCTRSKKNFLKFFKSVHAIKA